MEDLCRLAFGHVGLDWREHVVVDKRFMRPTEIEVQRGDYSKAQRKLGWQPSTTFPDLVSMMVDAELDRYRDGTYPVAISEA